MPHSNRLLSTLETELNRLVVFSYDLVRRLNGSGEPRTFLRAWLRNDAPVALADLRGTVYPAAARTFEATTFGVRCLAPGKEVEIALIPADRLKEVCDRTVLDQVAVVRFRSRVDLSSFAFSSLDRPVPYAERLAAWEPRVRSERKMRRPGPFRRAPALPVSG